MDWTHVLVALVSATLGAAAHKLYADATRRSYWADLGVQLRYGKRQKNSMRKNKRVGRKMFYGRLPNFRELDG